jgi:methionyl-tRNA synthetase
VRRCNKYIDETTPWVIAKDESRRAELAGIMYTLSEALRVIAVLISPGMPNTPKEIFKQLGIDDENLKSWDSVHNFGALSKEIKVNKGNVIFPRIDVKKELAELEEAMEKSMRECVANKGGEEKKSDEFITIDDFAKVELKVGEVIKCEKVEKADKLLKSQIKIGAEVRQVVSGIAKFYSPEEMVGKKVVVVTNLKPVKLRGILSEGMILAASDDGGNLKAVTVDGDIESGAEVR